MILVITALYSWPRRRTEDLIILPYEDDLGQEIAASSGRTSCTNRSSD